MKKLLFIIVFVCFHSAAQDYDIVIRNGRVMDPASGLDAVRHIGIEDKQITCIGEEMISGVLEIDAAGLVVSPGFIDLNAYELQDALYRIKVLDGVTSMLNLEQGAVDVAAWYAAQEGKSLINHGIGVDHGGARMMATGDSLINTVDGIIEAYPTSRLAGRAVSGQELDSMKAIVAQGLRDGAVAVSMGIEYQPGAAQSEILEMFKLAAQYGASVHAHMRKWDRTADHIDIYEIIAASVISGAAAHVNHLNSSAAEYIDRYLAFIDSARSRGVNITTECYPYTAGMTGIESAMFDDWESKPDSFFQRYQWPKTGERLTKASFGEYREQGGFVIIHWMEEEWIRTAVAHPLTIISSDGGWNDGHDHPRSAGTFARVLGHYAGNEQLLSLMEALRKMTILPARQLEGRVPGMRNKGRLQIGSDADIVVFDPESIIDRATYTEPALPSVGVHYVLVNGVPVVSEGKVINNVYPGEAIRAGITGKRKRSSIEPFDMIIENVTLIDGTGNAAREHVNVCVRGGKIVKIIAESDQLNAGEIIDGSGKYLIPGLIDGHAHPFPFEDNLPIFAHFGVTTIFVPGCSKCSNDNYARMRNFAADSSLSSPRVYHTSQHFTMEGRHPVKTYPDGSWVEGETVYYVRDTLQIESLVAEVAENPILGIKVTIEDGPAPPFVERIPVEFVSKIVREAHRRDLLVFAHVDDMEEVRIAQQSGVDHIIHFVGVDIDWTKDQAVIDDLLSRNISWVTTLMIDKSFFYPAHPEWLREVEARNIYPQQDILRLRASSSAEESMAFIREVYGEINGSTDPTLSQVLQPQIDDLRMLHQQGCNLVIGTDTGNKFIFPGLSMHEEMEIMCDGGFEPLEVIRMATRNGAEMLGILENFGTLEEGKIADMVLLDKNPLEDIRNTLAINTVFRNGQKMRRITNGRLDEDGQ